MRARLPGAAPRNFPGAYPLLMREQLSERTFTVRRG